VVFNKKEEKRFEVHIVLFNFVNEIKSH